MRTVLVFLLATSLLSFGQQVTHDAAGFERQYKVAFDAAAAAGNRDQVRHALDSFALPAEWFQQTFGAASDQLLQQYKTEFDYFEYRESRRIQMEVGNGVPVMQANIVKAHGLPYHQAKPAPTSLQPLPVSEEIEKKC